MVVNEIVTKFGFTGNPFVLGEFNKNLFQSITGLKLNKLAMGAAIGGLLVFSEKTVRALDSLVTFNQITGMSTSKLQQYGYAASMVGGDMEGMQRTIASLTQHIGEAALYGSEDFSRLGISVRDAYGHVKTAEQVLQEFQHRMSQMNLSLPERMSFAARLGIDPSFILLMQEGSGRMKQLMEDAQKLGTLTKEDEKRIREFNNSIRAMGYGLTSVKNEIAIGLSPVMEYFARNTTDFLVAHGPQIRGVIESMGDTFKQLAPSIGIVTAAMIGPIGFKWALSLIASPAAVFAGLVLIVDDLVTAFRGGKSVIRDFIQEFLHYDIAPYLQGLVKWAKDFTNELLKWDTPALSKRFKDLAEDAKAIARGFWGSSKEDSQEFFGGIRRESIGPGLMKDGQDYHTKMNSLPVLPFGISPGQNQSSTNNYGGNSVNQDVKINISTDNPSAAGASVRDALQGQLLDAYVQLQPRWS